MKCLVAALVLLPGLALAAEPAPLGPNNGQFGDWTAATYTVGGQKICYAFTTAQKTDAPVAASGQVMLTVTERPGARDEVTISAGYAYPKDAQVSLAVGTQKFDFYTKDSTAYTTMGTQAAAAFKAGDMAIATGTGPHGKPVTSSFSLKGVSGAEAAIIAACP
jgi:hypothetical protein